MAPVTTRGHTDTSAASESLLTLKVVRKSKRKTKDLEIALPVPEAKVSRHEGDIKDSFEFFEQIGSGGFADVFRASHKINHEVVAIKVIQKRKLSANEEDRVYNEIRILQKLYHPNIMRLKGFYEELNTFYLVLEYVGGGELFDRICKKTHYDEQSARDVMRTILHAIKHCHEQNIVHRDLKPENLMLLFPDNDASLKLIDFGLAAESHGRDLSGLLGTPQFMAPEIVLHHRYGKEVDMWAIGVILFCLLGGYYPFQEQSHAALFHQIKKGNFIFNSKFGWNNVSNSAKDLICRLLNPHPDKRYTVDQAIHHEWMLTKEAILRMKALPQAKTGIQALQAQKRWKKSIHAVLAVNRMKSLVLTPGAFKKTINSQDSTVVSEKYPITTSVSVATMTTTTSDTLSNRYTIFEQDLLHTSPTYKVVKGMNNDTKEIIAVKIIRQSVVTSREYEAFQQEITILRRLRSHPNILTFYDSFEISENDTNPNQEMTSEGMNVLDVKARMKGKRLLIMTEFIAGKELFDRISQHGTTYSEKQARRLAFSLLSAISCMHEHGIIHRDLRPDHLYLTNDSYTAEVKIVHFTSAITVQQLQENSSLYYADTSFHKYPYTSPELLQHYVYDQSTDIWSFGMILSFLLLGESPLRNPQFPPMASDDPQELLHFHSWTRWNTITKDARDLIQRCLCYRPRDRLSATEALAHRWFVITEEELSKVTLEETRASVRKYQLRRKFRVYVNALLLIIRIQRLFRQNEQWKQYHSPHREKSSEESVNREHLEAEQEEEREGGFQWHNCSLC